MTAWPVTGGVSVASVMILVLAAQIDWQGQDETCSHILWISLWKNLGHPSFLLEFNTLPENAYFLGA